MKKILFIHHGEGVGGASVSLINTILALDKSKYKVSVLLLKESNVVDLLAEKNINYTIAKNFFYRRFYKYFVHSEVSVIPLYRIDILYRQLFSWVLSKYFFAKIELNNLDFDLVHLNSSALTDWLLPSRRRGKVVIHIREPIAKGILGLRFKLMQREINKYADRVIAISKDNAIRLGLINKTDIIYNFVNISDINLKEDKQSGKILYLGGDDLIKGYLNVVNTLDHLDPSIKILFCGNYNVISSSKYSRKSIISTLKSNFPVQKKLRNAQIKMLSHPNAIFIGLVSNISDLMSECEFLISPFDKPHFSRPIFEAFAHRRTVIGTDVQGMEEVIENNFDGVIVRRNDPQELARAIHFLHYNSDMRDVMANRGFLKAKNMFNISNIKKIQDIYDAC